MEDIFERNYHEIFAAEHDRRWKRLEFPADGTYLSPTQAAALLEEHLIVAEDLIAKAALRLSPFGWLWFLRRMPETIFGWGANLESTAAYDRALAEILTGRVNVTFHCDPFRVVGGSITYPLDENLVGQVLRLCARVSLFSDIERQYRRASKGTAYRVVGRHLEPEREAKRDEAIRDFDKRAMQERHALEAGSETVVFAHALTKVDEYKDFILLTAARDQSGFVTRLHKSRSIQPEVTFPARYSPVFATIDPLLDLVETARQLRPMPIEPGLPELITLLATLALESILLGNEHAFLSIQRAGYALRLHANLNEVYKHPLLRHARARIENVFGVTLPSTGVGLLQSLQVLQGSARPLVHGPIVRPLDSQQSAVDVHMATRRVLTVGTGALREETVFRNVVADSFEGLTRRIVRETGKAPSGSIADLVGRTIRSHGRNITDLDAIADVDGTILLISCKSIAATPEHVSGLHRSVRNTADRLEKHVNHWTKILDEVTTCPRGDNYDLTGHQVLGVVITPRLHWAGHGVGQEIAMNRADGRSIRMVSSLTELQAFLQA